MKIAIHDHENNGYPNVALMKISAFHKQQGDTVEWYSSFSDYDKVYSSKVFTWTKRDPYLPQDTICGGTGFDIETVLNDEIELMCPDYTLYDCEKSYGFITRGCIRHCDWCFVPQKEGAIRAHQDIEDFTRHRKVVLMDNNILACEHGIKQLEKISDLKLTIDINQGIDARLIDNAMAKLLSKVKWSPSIRLACDSAKMIEPVRKAIELLRWHNTTPSRFFCYVLVKDVDDAVERVKFLKGMYIDVFCQPFRNKAGDEPTVEQKDFARWGNHKAVYKTVTWEDYVP